MGFEDNSKIIFPISQPKKGGGGTLFDLINPSVPLIWSLQLFTHKCVPHHTRHTPSIHNMSEWLLGQRPYIFSRKTVFIFRTTMFTWNEWLSARASRAQDLIVSMLQITIQNSNKIDYDQIKIRTIIYMSSRQEASKKRRIDVVDTSSTPTRRLFPARLLVRPRSDLYLSWRLGNKPSQGA